MASKQPSYKIKIISEKLVEMGMSSSFPSKRAFAISNTSAKIKEGNIDGVLVIEYGKGYKNEFPFTNFTEFNTALNAGTEKELLHEFAR